VTTVGKTVAAYASVSRDSWGWDSDFFFFQVPEQYKLFLRLIVKKRSYSCVEDSEEPASLVKHSLISATAYIYAGQFYIGVLACFIR
jgi:hypothetical protein